MCMSEVGSRKVRIVVNGETGHLVSNRGRQKNRPSVCLIDSEKLCVYYMAWVKCLWIVG